jgi:RNA polymerase sigma-70 factor (ECF subfamily)
MSIVRVTDAELVARAREGDHDAFGELVDRHRTAVYRAALAAVGSPAEAEDTAQDAFVLAFRRLATFRQEASFRTWLLTIAWNQAINRKRRRSGQAGRAGQARQAGEDTEAIPSAMPSPEELLSEARLRCDIVTEIRSLSPKLRHALLLAQSGEYSYEEIGAMLGAAVGTIKWRVSEARRIIRSRLRERGYADLG